MTEVSSSEGKAQIVASNITGSSRITKGRSITVNATILDTSFTFGKDEDPSKVIENPFVTFTQGDF